MNVYPGSEGVGAAVGTSAVGRTVAGGVTIAVGYAGGGKGQ